MAELKPCPFCGGRARVIQSDPLEKGKKEFYVFGVYCTDCGGLMRKCAEEDAVKAWNRRAEK
ncbi:MAG: Lar family restriction alleviation protein [Oscillospiraceae bacterium]|nr:Lar family restriction alleviation protein [Oscillospiraceae bacterium]